MSRGSLIVAHLALPLLAATVDVTGCSEPPLTQVFHAGSILGASKESNDLYELFG